jgi:uncharacterized protein YndB with AHSA1/START domain
MDGQDLDRAVRAEVIVPSRVDEVWEAWTTEEGVRTFFAPECDIELEPGGRYEMFFDLDAEPGSRGGEGMRVMAVQPKRMLAFTWNAPPDLPTVRGQRTHVVVRFQKVDEVHTKVTLVHDGWGEGEEWDAAYQYFLQAWKRVVLPRLKYRFSVGPLDWQQLPDLSKQE